ncbi:unnamed protein product [Urochloa humidicola]
MEHDAEMAPPIASHAPAAEAAADDWAARDDFEETPAESHSPASAAAPAEDDSGEAAPAPPAQGPEQRRSTSHRNITVQ